jgi:hypothetical protein
MNSQKSFAILSMLDQDEDARCVEVHFSRNIEVDTLTGVGHRDSCSQHETIFLFSNKSNLWAHLYVQCRAGKDSTVVPFLDVRRVFPDNKIKRDNISSHFKLEILYHGLLRMKSIRPKIHQLHCSAPHLNSIFFQVVTANLLN